MIDEDYIEKPTSLVIWKTIGAVLATISFTTLVIKIFSYIFFNIAKFVFGG